MFCRENRRRGVLIFFDDSAYRRLGNMQLWSHSPCHASGGGDNSLGRKDRVPAYPSLGRSRYGHPQGKNTVSGGDDFPWRGHSAGLRGTGRTASMVGPQGGGKCPIFQSLKRMCFRPQFLRFGCLGGGTVGGELTHYAERGHHIYQTYTHMVFGPMSRR